MSDGNDQTDEEIILRDEVSDEALEAAAGAMNWNAENMTISFCTGDVSCPF